jgi:hypothetical protein
MRRVIVALIIILIILSILLGGAWFISRRTATRNGTTPPSFKTFLKIGGKTPAPSKPDDGLSSDFGGQNPNTPPNGQATDFGGGAGYSNTDNAQSSQFTNTILSPVTGAGYTPGGTLGGADNGGGGDTDWGSGRPNGSGTTSGNQGTTTGGTSGQNTGSTTGATSNDCSDDDTNISFTPEELQRLSALQERFYTIAQNLHTDADVKNELANYDSFKVEEAQILEMTLSCKGIAQKLPAIYQARVPTPYWHDTTTDNVTFLIPLRGALPTAINSDDINQGKTVLERLLRINFW